MDGRTNSRRDNEKRKLTESYTLWRTMIVHVLNDYGTSKKKYDVYLYGGWGIAERILDS